MDFEEKKVGEFLLIQVLSGAFDEDDLDRYIDCAPYIEYSTNYAHFWHRLVHYSVDEDIRVGDPDTEERYRRELQVLLEALDDYSPPYSAQVGTINSLWKWVFKFFKR